MMSESEYQATPVSDTGAGEMIFLHSGVVYFTKTLWSPVAANG